MGFWSSVKKVANGASSLLAKAGHAVEGLGHEIATGVRALGAGVDAIRHGLGWLNSWLCNHAGAIGCRVGNIVLGGLSGLLKGVSITLGKVADAIEHLGGLLGALLRLDFPGVISQLGLLVLDAVELALNGVRSLSGLNAVGGMVDAWQAEDLKRFVEDLLKSRFSSDPTRLQRIQEHLGLNGNSWGLPLRGMHFVYCLDSATVPLWQWHEAGTIDLYAMADLLSFESFSFGRPRTSVRVIDQLGNATTFPATRSDIAAYLDSKGTDVRLQVFSRTNTAIKEFTSVATQKHARIGVRLSWNTDDLQLGELPPCKVITLQTEYVSPNALEQYVTMKGWRLGTREEQCDALAIAGFELEAHLGWTFGQSVGGGSSVAPCPRDRTDHCCNTIPVTPTGVASGSGVIYTDQYPSQIFRYVLAHELGHYIGLCHWPHDGFQNIMYTPKQVLGSQENLHWYSWGLLKYFLQSEPEFTLEDGKNAWRFIVAEMYPCLVSLDAAAPRERRNRRETNRSSVLRCCRGLRQPNRTAAQA